MNSVYEAQEVGFSYDPSQSTNEGRSVTNFHNISHSFVNTITVPSGTAGLTIWVNNRKYFNDFRAEGYQVMIDQWDYRRLASMSAGNAAFSAAWINITNDPLTYLSSSCFYINTTFRFIRLQGASASSITGSIYGTGEIAWLWTGNSEPGR